MADSSASFGGLPGRKTMSVWTLIVGEEESEVSVLTKRTYAIVPVRTLHHLLRSSKHTSPAFLMKSVGDRLPSQSSAHPQQKYFIVRMRPSSNLLREK